MQVIFHTFNIGDVDDVDIYAGQAIYEWQQTEHGKWVMDHASDLTYHTRMDSNYWGYDIVITGKISDQRHTTEYFLKWPKKS